MRLPFMPEMDLVSLPLEERPPLACRFAFPVQRAEIFVGDAQDARSRHHFHFDAVAKIAFADPGGRSAAVGRSAVPSRLAQNSNFALDSLDNGIGEMQIGLDREGKPVASEQALEAVALEREGLKRLPPAGRVERLLERWPDSHA